MLQVDFSVVVNSDVRLLIVLWVRDRCGLREVFRVVDDNVSRVN